MRFVDVIEKKADGGALTKQEIEEMVNGFVKGDIPDYQMSSMMMAILQKDMTDQEIADLTMAMMHSGDIVDLSDLPGVKVDKHSTGGVGDTTTLVVAPLVAACGGTVAKMSGRGLGHTGGTIDKLESFPGFSTGISTEEFIDHVNTIGISIMGQTKDLAPADKKLYALRDVTATVDQMSLIASSIMSKKLAAGADAIVLDVKTGSGAFMKTREDALALAKEMVQLGKNAGRKTIAVVSNMDQPLGNTVGNALEVREAIDTLNGNGPRDFTELVMTLGSYMLLAGGKADKEETARRMLRQVVEDGSALRKLAEFVKAQGGDESYVYEPEKLPCAKIRKELLAPVDGYIQRIVCDEVGICSLILGGGRETKESQIDLSVGIRLIQKIGKYVHKGDVLAEVFANDCQKLEEAMTRLQQAYHIGPDEAKEQNVILDVVK